MSRPRPRLPGQAAATAWRYLREWRRLPDAERRARASRVIERWLLRHRGLRRLGRAVAGSGWASFARALDGRLEDLPDRLRAEQGERGPLWAGLEARARWLAEHRPDAAADCLARTGAVLEHRLVLLGAPAAWPHRPDGGVDWHCDWSSGRRWDPDTYYADLVLVRGDGGDIKRPWELARFQHLLDLGTAHSLAPFRLPAAEADRLRRRLADEARVQIGDWLAHNPPALGIHWASPMEVGLRAVSWLAALAFLRRDPRLEDAFLLELARALWRHGRHLRRNLERWPGGRSNNHLLANLCSLLLLSYALPELSQAREWRELAAGQLESEVARQVLPEGVLHERSLGYQALVAEMLLQAILAARAARHDLPAVIGSRLAAMLEVLDAARRPDGSLPAWGDGDDGRFLPLVRRPGPHLGDIDWLLLAGGRLLGHQRWERGGEAADLEAIWLGLDRAGATGGEQAGPVGPVERRLPGSGLCLLGAGDVRLSLVAGPADPSGWPAGHAHNDLLSFTCWSQGREWVSDPGTGTYSADPALRNRLRSTAAHATLQIGGREQEQMGEGAAGLFELGTSARTELLRWEPGPVVARLVGRSCAHAVPGPAWVHERSMVWERPEHRLEIDDEARPLDSGGAEAADLHLPLAPGVVPEAVVDAGDWPQALVQALRRVAGGHAGLPRLIAYRLVSSRPAAVVWLGLALPGGAVVSSEGSVHSPAYGHTTSSHRLRAALPPSLHHRCRTVLLLTPGSGR